MIMRKGLKFLCLSFLFMFLMNSCSDATKDMDNVDKKEQIVVDNLMTRRSIRSYKDEVVPRDIMNVILECAIYAPNGMNKQPWEIRVVDNPEILNGMTEAYLAGIDENDPYNPKKDPNFKIDEQIFPQINTLVSDSELRELVEVVGTCLEYGVDAFIVQDYGVIGTLKCEDCGYENNFDYDYHYSFEYKYYITDLGGACPGYISYYSCPCGINNSIVTQN